LPQIGVAILGFGFVGRSFVRLTQSRSDLHVEVLAVSDRSGTAAVHGTGDLDRLIATKEAGTPVARSATSLLPGPGSAGWSAKMRGLGVRAVVNCLQTNLASGEPGLSWMLDALSNGLDVVTVDKGPVVHGFRILTEAAASHGTRLRFGGTAGVAVALEPPVTPIERIEGVLNGTTNYILTRMLRTKASLAEALADARRTGIAERNPRFDIEGWDSACKVVILANALMGSDARLDHVDRHGIEEGVEELVGAARSTGSVVRLVARAGRNRRGVDLAVRPEVVGPDSMLYSVDGTSKAAVLDDAKGNRRLVQGVSSPAAIAATIVSDLQSLLPT
jgi:homoserine dehydrogenase